MDRRGVLGVSAAAAVATKATSVKAGGLSATERLFAIEEIKVLKARYFRYVDTKDWKGLAGLFTLDATLFFPENQQAPAPVDVAMKFIVDALDGAVSIHHGHMGEIEIQSPTMAHGIWAMEDRIFWAGDKARLLGLAQLHGHGHYHEDYVRSGEKWLIHRLRLSRLWLKSEPPTRSIA